MAKGRFVLVASTQGRGHRSRMQALAEEVEARGHQFHLVEADTVQEALGSPILSGTSVINAWVVDCRDQKGIRMLNESGARVVAVDDACTPGLAATVVVAPAANVSPWPYRHSYAALQGPPYALIRRAFRGRLWDGEKGAVVDAREFKDLSPDEVADEMCFAGVVISEGGVRCLEAASMGVPVVLDLAASDQVTNVVGLVRAGAALNASTEALREVADSLLGSPLRYVMSRRGVNLIDGRGAERVVDMLEQLVGVA